MTNNIFMKFLCSIPMILIFLYFIPALGICLLLIKYFAYSTNTKLTPIVLIGTGLILLVPKFASYIGNLFNYNMDIIPYFNQIITSDIYNIKIINYCKLLVIAGIIFVILNFFFNKLVSAVKNYFAKLQRRDYEIAQKNDLIIKEKQEKARNTTFVSCPHCGADNIITGKTGICKYCRRTIQVKD